MEYRDRVLKCIDCEAEFVFTAGEQLFFADKGFIDFRISKGTRAMPTANRMRECRTTKASAIDAASGGAGGGTL